MTYQARYAKPHRKWNIPNLRTAGFDQSYTSSDTTFRSRHASTNHSPSVTYRSLQKGADILCSLAATELETSPDLIVMATTENTTSAPKTQIETPWHAAYPAPRNAPPASISCAELLQYFRDGKKAGKDFILIDLRRNDHEVRSRSLVIIHSA